MKQEINQSKGEQNATVPKIKFRYRMQDFNTLSKLDPNNSLEPESIVQTDWLGKNHSNTDKTKIQSSQKVLNTSIIPDSNLSFKLESTNKKIEKELLHKKSKVEEKLFVYQKQIQGRSRSKQLQIKEQFINPPSQRHNQLSKKSTPKKIKLQQSQKLQKSQKTENRKAKYQKAKRQSLSSRFQDCLNLKQKQQQQQKYFMQLHQDLFDQEFNNLMKQNKDFRQYCQQFSSSHKSCLSLERTPKRSIPPKIQDQFRQYIKQEANFIMEAEQKPRQQLNILNMVKIEYLQQDYIKNNDFLDEELG